MSYPFQRLAKPFLREIKKLVLVAEKRRVQSLTGLVPITHFEEEDIFLVAYPKSGITWLQNIVAGIIYGVGSEHVPDTLIQDLVPDVHYKRFYKRYQTPMYFKSHALPNPQYKHVVYLLRDGRDVMVSYFHHNSALRGEPVDFYRMVRLGEGIPYKWHEHVEAWLDNPYCADMITIRYEHLKQNPLEEMERFCEFVKIERDRDFLKNVLSCTNFDVMRSKEVRYGWEDKRWPKDKPFVRRGQIGSYKDEMPLPVLNAFLDDAESTLRKLGYL